MRDVLDLTPPSITDETDVEPGPSRKVLRPMTENGENQSALKAPSPVVTLRTSTPKPNRSAASRLRAKLKEKNKSLQTKDREIDRLRKQVKRMKMRKEETKTRNKLTKDVRSSVKRRQLMGSAIRTFFHHDDVSTIVNGKAGEIRRGGQVFRRRFLCDTIENLHKRFLMEDPSKKISRAQFYKCRPFWISSPTLLDRETCACKIHKNFESKIKKLHQLVILNGSSCLEVVDSVVCERGNMECMYRQCKDCQSKSFSPMLDPNTRDNIVQWKEWVSRSTPISKKGQNGSTVEIEVKTTSLEKCSASIEKLVSLTEESLPRFCKHTYNIKHQFQYIQSLKSNLQEDEAVVHVDYSENYNCKWNREIQEAHFGGSHKQVTLHTGVLYLSEGRLESFASVSDCLRHDAAATWAHLDPVLEYLRSHYPAITKVHFLSDGPTSQYRNTTAFYLT